MEGPLTVEDARRAFDALATLDGVSVAFRWLREGCECRAQLMVEALLGIGRNPGRVWAVAVDRPLRATDPSSPQLSHAWGNHVAPTLAVAEAEHGVLVLDPSLSRTGPLTLTEWAGAMKARSVEVFRSGLSQAEILERQRERALRGEGLDAVLFLLPLGEPPIPEKGGSGFRIEADPPQGPTVYARERMHEYLRKQRQNESGRS